MLLLKDQEQLLLLQKELENLIPLSLKVYGSVSNMLRGNPFLQEPLVDSWPDFNVVLVRPQKKQRESNDSDTYMNSYVYFFKDLKSVSESFMDAIDWTQAFEVQGLQCSLEDMLVEAAQRRHTQTEIATLVTFCQEKGNYFTLNLSRDIKPTISTLTPSHAELVDKSWSFGGNDSSRRYVTTCIKNSPSRCVMINERESPISWALTDQYGAIRMAYTLPDYRGNGYAKLIITSLSEVLRQDGSPVYCHVMEDNPASKALFMGAGFREVIGGKLLWFQSSPMVKIQF